MKLDKLWIDEFKNLKNVKIDFDQDELVTVIIGWNGAGKSNVIEALVIIFRDLDLGKPPRFKYTLEYICREKRIMIDADPAQATQNRYEIKVCSVEDSGESEKYHTKSFKEFHSDPQRQWLPSNVFGYYSGPSDRLGMEFQLSGRNLLK